MSYEVPGTRYWCVLVPYLVLMRVCSGAVTVECKGNKRLDYDPRGRSGRAGTIFPHTPMRFVR